jgi:putative membrane protein
MPDVARRIVRHPISRGVIYVLQQPALAIVLFVGLFFFWLIPAVHFRAMIDPTLYRVMNWSMTADGILFWCLVLDPRAAPPARASFGARAALTMMAMFPQIIGGAMITFSPRDLYSFYDLCGRIYPGLGAHYDQVVGGLITWIPPAMMSILGLVLVLNTLRKVEERQFAADNEGYAGPMLDARRWTG